MQMRGRACVRGSSSSSSIVRPAVAAAPTSRPAPSAVGARLPAALPAALSTADFDEGAAAPPGCARYKVSLSKPLGLVLEQDLKTLAVRVASVAPEGAAEKAGVGAGDQLIAVSGIVYDRVEAYGEVKVSKGQSRIRLAARGETLKTLAAAIASHPGNWEVALELQRCEGAQAAGGGGAGGAGGSAE